VGVDKSLAAFKANAEGVIFSSNCSKPGCLITVCGSSPLVLWYSSFTGVNVPGVESVLCAADSSQVTITNSTFSDNRARAIQARDTANVTVTDSKILDNVLQRADGGGVWLGAGSPSLTMLNSTVSGNKARSGGGLWLGGSATAVINSSSISGNQGTAPRGTPAAGLGGGVAVTEKATVELGGTTNVDGNTAGTSGAGVYSAGSAALIVAPGVKFGSNKVANKSFGYDVAASGASRLELPPVTFANSNMFSAVAGISKCSKGVALERSPCGVGEFKDNRTGVCMCCPERTYSLDASGTCLACPERGACPGGDALQPMPGFWRSSNQSTQMHMCPLGKVSCAGGDTCQPGYDGRLCAGCEKGWGMVGPLRCGKCMSPRAQFAIYIVICIVTVFFVAITVHFTYADNVEGSTDLRPSDIIKVLVNYAQFHSIIGCVTIPWPDFFGNLFRASEGIFGVTSGAAMSMECWMAQYARAPRDKLPGAIRMQLVMYMAVVLVFAAVVVLRLLWWVSMHGVSSVVRNTSSGCVSPGCVKKIQPSTFRSLLRKLPVTVLVVLFYAYPTLLRTSLMFFACMPIDSASPGSLVKLLSHKGGYFAMDLTQECWAGWHRTWALGLGIPSLILTCVVIPVGMFWLLKANAPRLDELKFREHFGFLYRNYRQEWCWWEAIWAVQKIAMSVIGMVHFALGAYHSMLLMLAVFSLAAVSQSSFKPYSIRKLHQVQYGSTATLFLTTLAGLAMFSLEGSPGSNAMRMVVAVLTMVLDIGFVVWCLIEAAKTSSGGIKRVAGKVVGCVTGPPPAPTKSSRSAGPFQEHIFSHGSGISEALPMSVSTQGSSSQSQPKLSFTDSAQQVARQLNPKGSGS
jgi:hypothetical protein